MHATQPVFNYINYNNHLILSAIYSIRYIFNTETDFKCFEVAAWVIHNYEKNIEIEALSPAHRAKHQFWSKSTVHICWTKTPPKTCFWAERYGLLWREYQPWASDSCNAPTRTSIFASRIAHLLAAYYSNKFFTSLVKGSSWPNLALIGLYKA